MKILEAYPILLQGAMTTLTITLTAVFFGLLFGFILAIFRTCGNKFLDTFAKIYINTFRSIPLIMLLLGAYLVAPGIIKSITGITSDIRMPTALITFSLFEAAFFAEIIRSGFNSVATNQNAAAYSLGFNKFQTYLYITMPQAFKNSLPVIITQSIILFQDTSLVYVIGLADFFGTAVKVGERDGILTQSIIFASIVYLIVCVSLQRIINKLKGNKL